MIQTTLFFILGFLSAGFLALLVAPAIWRRAVALTKKRVEAAMPQTIEEIQAGRDQVRAELAISMRQLEMQAKSLKEKSAAQMVEIGRCREELSRVVEERDGKAATIAELERQAEELRAALAGQDERIEALSGRLAEREDRLAEQAEELDTLGRMFDEASFNASSRQIEIVAQEAKLEKLTGDVAELRGERKEADKRVREVAAEYKAAREALRGETRKVAALEKQVARLTASLSDHEEKLERRERELARLREEAKGKASGDAPPADGAGKTAGKPVVDRQRLEERLTVLTRENRKLRARLGEMQGGNGDDRDPQHREEAVLRDQIADLAAEVVNLTAKLDGPDSPIRKALAASPAGAAGKGRGTSLAERIRALQAVEAPGARE